ncbi:MAG TPA: hypothetical protein VE781_06220, partial [Kineosporiaceae bacterium]|nr:hypothetical protein [Kineosporiaceae bacterium]
MSAAGDLREQVADAHRLPVGREQLRRAEDLVARADELGDVAAQVDARLLLISAVNYGDTAAPERRYGAFAWVLARWDEDPTVFDRLLRHQLFWYFKWVTVGAVDFPQVPLAQLERSLADMHDRYLRAGEGLAPVHHSRFRVFGDVGGQGDPRTAAAYREWMASPRTELSDCVACEPTDRVERLVALGADEEAIEVAVPVLQDAGCREQPARMINSVLPALLRTGRTGKAAAEHARAVRQSVRLDGATARLD